MNIIGIRDYFKQIFKNKEFADQVKILREANETVDIVLKAETHTSGNAQLVVTDSSDNDIVIDCGTISS